jgi:hypothetical protein
MTPEAKAEYDYRVTERLGIMCGEGEPTLEQINIAHSEAAAAIAELYPEPTPQHHTMKPIRITNKHNLPAGLVAAVTYSERDREGCDYTITELLEPPRILALKKLNHDRLEEDASDRLWALMGSAGHEVLKRSAKQSGKAIVEERAVVEVKCGGRSYKIGGQLDYATADAKAEEQDLTDFKFTSVWAVKEGCKPEWVQQLNCYRYLCSHYGIPIKRMEIVAIMRDWSTREAKRDPEYPQVQVQVFEIPIWDLARVEEFICERITMHELAKATLPECTPEDTWEKRKSWAAKKKGGKRAKRVFINEVEANEFAAREGLEVEFRPGERPRCESYCVVAPFCQQFITWQMNNS